MWKNKMKELFIKLAMCLTIAALAGGLILFVVKEFYQKADIQMAKEENSSSVNAADDKKAPPIERKGSVSDDSSKKDTADKEKNTAKEDSLVTIVPKESQETPEQDDSPVSLEQEAIVEPPASDTGSSMAASLEAQIQDMISSQYMAGGTVAVSAGRIADGVPVLVNDHSMQAASLIKLFVAGCIYETLGDTSQYESLISSMISVSDNSACNSLVTTLGGGDAQAGMTAVNEYCMNHGFSETHMGRLMLQPNDLDDNYTSVRDCGNFLQAIYNGSLAGSSQILQYMKQQERRGKIPAGVPAGIETANKTGELDFVENDAAIIFHPSGAYVLCVMSEQLSDAYTSRLFINSLSEMVYGLMG